MTKISGSTFYFKKAFPGLWFGFLAVFLFSAMFAGSTDPISYVGPIVMAGFGFVMFRKLVWDLSDEVYDAGDHLIFRKGGVEQRVKLADISNIDYGYLTSPERVTIHTRTAGPLGRDLVFCLPMRFNFFSKSPLVSQLIERVDRARNA